MADFAEFLIWHVACFVLLMQSRIIALLVPRSGPRATLLVRRRDGQFTLEGIDARVASATQVAATWFRRGAPIVDPVTSTVVGYEVTETPSR